MRKYMCIHICVYIYVIYVYVCVSMQNVCVLGAP